MPIHSESAPRPAALACAQCRSRHLKCDGRRPVCRRCSVEGCECQYTPSRRGQRRRAQRPGNSNGNSHDGDSIPVSAASKSPVLSQSFPAQSIQTINAIPPSNVVPPESISTEPVMQLGDHDGTLTELYFANFHHTHPILVPKTPFNALPLPASLRAVVRFIGSIISPLTSSDQYKLEAMASLKQDLSWTPFRVQALLLYAIALHATDSQADAHKALGSAVDLANLLGMNRYGFAHAHSGNQTLLEESFRRTWWELFTVEGMFAAIQQRSTFRCNTVELDAGLPCDEQTFLSGACLPQPPTLAQFDNRLFDDDEVSYSSYCYRIEAVRILARVLVVAEDPDVEKDEYTAVDNALAGWKYHLPQHKADIANIENGGEVDELMFQAHLIINNATILLHLPRTNLRYIQPLTTPVTCCPWSRPLAPRFSLQNHLMKVTQASQGLSDLAALRSAYAHTPLTACGLILGSLVQLSICSLHASNCITQHRERVMLMIGVLKSLGRTWPLAQEGLTQLRAAAKEVLQRPTDTSAAPVADESLEESPANYETPEGDFSQIDISWMDELLHQPMQTMHQPFEPIPIPPPSMHPTTTSAAAPLTYNSFLNL